MKGCVFREIQNTVKIFCLQSLKKNIYIPVILQTPRRPVNPEKPDVPLNKNDAFQKVQKRRVQEKR